jgi:hypothetical protein
MISCAATAAARTRCTRFQECIISHRTRQTSHTRTGRLSDQEPASFSDIHHRNSYPTSRITNYAIRWCRRPSADRRRSAARRLARSSRPYSCLRGVRRRTWGLLRKQTPQSPHPNPLPYSANGAAAEYGRGNRRRGLENHPLPAQSPSPNLNPSLLGPRLWAVLRVGLSCLHGVRRRTWRLLSRFGSQCSVRIVHPAGTNPCPRASYNRK